MRGKGREGALNTCQHPVEWALTPQRTGGAGAKQTRQFPHKGTEGWGTCTPAGHEGQQPRAALRTAKAPPRLAHYMPMGAARLPAAGVRTDNGLAQGRPDDAKRAWI